MNDTEQRHLGEDDSAVRLERAADNREAALQMAQQARRRVDIFTLDLESAIYNQAPFEEALSRLLRSTPSSRARILVQESSHAVQTGHCLIHLAQRLSSHIEIRKPATDYAGMNEAFLIADETGYIHRTPGDQYEGVANFKDRYTARQLTALFNEIWERSQPDPQVRRLYI